MTLRRGFVMNCWHCKTELIWGGDHDLEDDEDDDHCMVTNLSCPACRSLVYVYMARRVMAKWGFDMIDREIYMRLLEELERLKAENKELRKEVDKFQRKTAGMYE